MLVQWNIYWSNDVLAIAIVTEASKLVVDVTGTTVTLCERRRGERDRREGGRERGRER